MAQITKQDISLCYSLGVEFAKGILPFDEAVDTAANSGMNRASASDYIRNVKYMTDGFTYKRTISAQATEYYLSRIGADFGNNGLTNAVRALSGHIGYYETLQSVTLHKLRNVLAHFENLAGSETAIPKEVISSELKDLQNDFQSAVNSSASQATEHRLERLKQASVVAKEIRVATTAYVRNPDVVAQRLYQANGICEGCGKPAPFHRDDGSPFLEVHHILPLSQKGLDVLDNTLALCPNCHREAHYGSNRERFCK